MNPPGLFVRSMRSRVAPASVREVIVVARSTRNWSLLGSSKDPTKSYQQSIVASGERGVTYDARHIVREDIRNHVTSICIHYCQ